MAALTDALLAELSPVQRLMVRAMLASLKPAEQADMEAALLHVLIAKRDGDGRPVLAILQDWMATREGAPHEAP